MKPPNALPHKTENGNVVVTTHLYDGKKSLPLDIELYQHSDSLPEGKKAHRPLGGFLRVRTEQADPEFKKKPTLALELIDKSRARGYRPGIVLIDSSYGNNTSFLKELEERYLNYLGGIAKNRNILVFCAYTFIIWHKLTGGLRRRWANKLPTHLEFNSRWKVAVHSAPLNTFPEAKTVISYSHILSFCRMAEPKSSRIHCL